MPEILFPKSYLLLPVSSLDGIITSPREEILTWSIHGDEDPELVEQMSLANKAGDEFLAGQLDFATYCDVLEYIDIDDPYKLLADIIDPYCMAGLT